MRPATQEDAPVIAALEAAAAHHPWSEDAVRSSLGSHTTLAWLVGDPPVGHLLASAVAEEGEILTLGVHPGHRRRGHAASLMRACQAAWVAHGVRTGWLEVRDDNRAAIELYRGLGWVDAGRRPRYYSDGRDACVMRWDAP